MNCWQHQEKDRQQGQGQGQGPVRSTDAPDCRRRHQYHAQRLQQQQQHECEHLSPHYQPKELRRPQPQPQPGRQHEQHEQGTPQRQQQYVPVAAPAAAPPLPPLPELPFRPTPGSYTCDFLLEGRRSTPTPSELARSLRFAYRLLLGPSMGAVPSAGVTTSGGPTETETSPSDVLSEILALPQACFLTMLPHDPPRVVVAHSLGRYHPPSSFLGDSRDPHRNRIVAFVGERSGVVGNGGRGVVGMTRPRSTTVRDNPHHHGFDDDGDGGERLLDDVVAGGDDSACGVSLPSLFIAPRASSTSPDVSGELFGPRKYSLVSRGALDRFYSGGGSCGRGEGGSSDDSEVDGEGDHRHGVTPPAGSSNPTDYDAEAGGGVEEAYLTKLAYIPPSWAVHFLGGMGPYQALELATRLVSVSLPSRKHGRTAEPLLRWLRLACQSDLRRVDRASAACVDWAPVLEDGGGAVRGFAVRRMRSAMRATVAVAAVAAGSWAGGGGGAGQGWTEELLAPHSPRREMVVDDDDGGDAASHHRTEASRGAIASAEEGGGEDDPDPLSLPQQSPKKPRHTRSGSPPLNKRCRDEHEEGGEDKDSYGRSSAPSPSTRKASGVSLGGAFEAPPPLPQQSPKKLRHTRSGSPPLNKRCRDEHEEGDEDKDSYGRSSAPPPSPQGVSGVNLGGAFEAHGAENGGSELSTGAAAVRKCAPLSPTRDEEASERRHHEPGGGCREGGGEGNDRRPSNVSASSSSGGDTFSAIPAAPPYSIASFKDDDDASPPPPRPPIHDRHNAPPPSFAAARRVSAEDVRGSGVGVEVRASPAGPSSSPSSTSSCSKDQQAHRGYPLHNVENYHPHDVLCRRGGGTNTKYHVGNENWRNLVAANKWLYISLPKKQKRFVAQSIVKLVRAQKPPGRFLQKNPETGLYSDIGDKKAQDKTAQALREGALEIRKVMRSEKKLGMQCRLQHDGELHGDEHDEC